MKRTKLKAPSHLSDQAKRLWRSTVENYNIDPQAGMVLQAGLEALDRREQAREAIAAHGATIKDRWNIEKVSPWVGIERDSAATLCKCFRLLGFDLAHAGEGKR